MYLSLSQSQSSLSDPIGGGSRLESIVISQLEGIYSQIEDVFQCVKSDSNNSQIHQATDYVTSRLNLEIRKFKFSNSSKSILESSMIQFIRRVSPAIRTIDFWLNFRRLDNFDQSELSETCQLRSIGIFGDLSTSINRNFRVIGIFSLYEWIKHFTSVKLKLAN